MRKLPRILSPRHLSRALLLGFVAAAGTIASHPANAGVGISISVGIAPPPLIFHEQPMIPGPGYLWVPGYWAWDSDIGDYYWVPGQWVLPPFAGALWTPGYWAWNDGYYLFHRGYWGPVVGYYGGINYGHGYFGFDYVGGYWNRGVFNYNTAYNRIDNHVVNVYNRTTIINNTTVNRISYNGGPGGIKAQPTARQRQLDNIRKWDPVPAQREALVESRNRPDAHFGHGRNAGDASRWGGNPPAPPAMRSTDTVRPVQPQTGRDTMRWRPPRDMMPTDGTQPPRETPRSRPGAPWPSAPTPVAGERTQPVQQPRQWEGARQRMPPPDRATREEHRPMDRPPMPSPEFRPRPMQQPQWQPQPQRVQPQPRPAMQPRFEPMPARAAPASRPAPPAHAPRDGTPHRDDHHHAKDAD